jgi:hypothetical protein
MLLDTILSIFIKGEVLVEFRGLLGLFFFIKEVIIHETLLLISRPWSRLLILVHRFLSGNKLCRGQIIRGQCERFLLLSPTLLIISLGCHNMVVTGYLIGS